MFTSTQDNLRKKLYDEQKATREARAESTDLRGVRTRPGLACSCSAHVVYAVVDTFAAFNIFL
jgi:hypothetical protein